MSEDKKKIIEQSPEGEINFTAYGEFISYFHTHIDLFKKLLKSKGKAQEQVDSTIKTVKTFMTANIKKPDHFFEKLPDLCSLLGYPEAEVSEFLNKNFAETLAKVQEKLKTQENEKKDETEANKDKVFDSLIQEIAEGISFSFPKHHRFKTSGMLMVLENTKTGEVFEPQGLMAQSANAASVALETANAASAAKEAKIQAEIDASAVPLPAAPIPVAAPKPTPKPAAVSLPPEPSLLQEIYEKNKSSLTGERLKVRTGPDSDSDLGRPSPPVQDRIIDDLDNLQLKAPTSPVTKPTLASTPPFSLPTPPPSIEEDIPSFDDFDIPEPASVSTESTDLSDSFDDFGLSSEPETITDEILPEETFPTESSESNSDEEEEEFIPRRREPVSEDLWEEESAEPTSSNDGLGETDAFDFASEPSSEPGGDFDFGEPSVGESPNASGWEDESSGALASETSSDSDFDFMGGDSPASGVDSEVSDYGIRSYFQLADQVRQFEVSGDQSRFQAFFNDLSNFEKAVVTLRSHLQKETKGEMIEWESIVSSLSSKSQLSSESTKALHQKLDTFQFVQTRLDSIVQEFGKTDTATKDLFRKAWPHVQGAFLSFPELTEIEQRLKKILTLVPGDSAKKEFTKILTSGFNLLKEKVEPGL